MSFRTHDAARRTSPNGCSLVCGRVPAGRTLPALGPSAGRGDCRRPRQGSHGGSLMKRPAAVAVAVAAAPTVPLLTGAAAAELHLKSTWATSKS